MRAAWALLLLLPAAFAAVTLQPEEPQQSFPLSLPVDEAASEDLSLDEPPLVREKRLSAAALPHVTAPAHSQKHRGGRGAAGCRPRPCNPPPAAGAAAPAAALAGWPLHRPHQICLVPIIGFTPSCQPGLHEPRNRKISKLIDGDGMHPHQIPALFSVHASPRPEPSRALSLKAST